MKKVCNIILILAIVAGIVASGFCLGGRVKQEEINRDVTVVMSAHDVLTMAALGGGDAQEMYYKLNNAGVKYAENNDDLFFLTKDTTGAEVEQAVTSGKTPVLTEDEYQMGADITKEAHETILELQAQCVKCFLLTDKYAARYNYLGETGAQEIENIFYRAITDRNIRVIYIKPFMDGEEMVTDVDEYVNLIDNLRQRLVRHDIAIEGKLSVGNWYEPPFTLLVVASLGVCAGGVLILRTFIRKGQAWQLITLFAVFLMCAAGLRLKRAEFLPVLSLGASVVMPSLGVMVFTDGLSRMAYCRCSLAGSMVRYITLLIPAMGCSLMGGVFVGALMSSTEYMLELRMFTGVKLSQLVPIVYCLYSVWIAVYHITGRIIKNDVKAAWENFKHGGRIKIIVIVVAIVLVIAVFIMRTGDGMLSATGLELKFRNLLEQTLYVRPRTKEMLIAWPCAGAAIVCACRGWKNALLPLTILVTIGLASVCNTFCHIRADFFLSLSRAFIALLIGAILGAIVLCVLHVASKITIKEGRK